ncbi:helix-turn-helix domain-containing protein (plasmid) [Paenibacillus polymyxa]|uniref:helix-turn-helix domain-containing protein n=1 Tax=Paenibacillus polymyxa TaxID=1406 RepID=UPI003B5A84EF
MDSNSNNSHNSDNHKNINNSNNLNNLNNSNDFNNTQAWKEIKKELNYKSEIEKEVFAHMAKLVNELVYRRKKLNLTQRELAKKAGITQAQVARLETSYSVPSLETIMKVALALELRIGFDESSREQNVTLE